jgi:indolepyruvate decarboxylase
MTTSYNASPLAASSLLVISGAPGLRESEEHPLQHHRIRADQTQLRLFREVTVASAVLDSGRTAAQELVRVLEEMRRESRPGYLELPADCLNREMPWPIDLAPPRSPPSSRCPTSRWEWSG